MDPTLIQGYNTAGRALPFFEISSALKKITLSVKHPSVMNKTLNLTQGFMILVALRGVGIYSVFFFLKQPTTTHLFTLV